MQEWMIYTVLAYLVILFTVGFLFIPSKQKMDCPSCRGSIRKIKGFNWTKILNPLTFLIFKTSLYKCKECKREVIRFHKRYD